MAIVSGRDRFRFYKYIVKEIYILFDGEEKKLDNERLNSFSVIENYIDNLYPIIKCQLALEDSIYYRILREKNNVRFKIYFQTYYRENTDKTTSLKTKAISEIFTLILDDDDEYLTKDLREDEYPTGDENQMNAVTSTVELFLFKSDLIRANRTLQNDILENCTVTTALAYLLTKINAKNTLMTRADNQTIYPEIVIPPLQTSAAFAYLDSYYGIHDTGSVIFFGLNRSYILKFLSKNSAVEENEVEQVSIIIPKVGSIYNDNICQVYKPDDNKRGYVVADPMSFKPQNQDTSGKILNPEDVDIVDSSTGEIEESEKENKSVFIQKTENPYIGNIYRTKINSSGVVIHVFLRDVNLGLITPNKRFQFVFEDTSLAKKYKGDYFLCERDFSLIKEGKEFTIGMNLVLRKI